jgi:hypothetical protein
MRKVWYVVQFQTTGGAWVELPRCEEPEVAAMLVRALLRATKQVGNVVQINRWEELTPE